jgi:hypothetical protein
VGYRGAFVTPFATRSCFEVTDDEVWVVVVQFAIRDPADLEAEAAGRTFD